MFSLEDLIVTTLSFIFMLINNIIYEEIKSALIKQCALTLKTYKMKET